MNMQYSRPKIVTVLAATAGLILASASAHASWLSPAFYGDDLDRCTARLRAELNTTGATGLRHTVTDIDKVGVWYVFDIETDIVDDTGAVIREAKTRCKSHRWRQHTVVEVTHESPAADLRLASSD